MPNNTPPTPEAIADATTFLREILQLMDTTWGDPEQVFPFFQQNLKHFNEFLIHAIPQEFAERIAQEPPEKHWRIAALFVIFGVQLSEFPLGDRALNLETSISAYQAALQIYTRETFPQDWAMTQNNLSNAYSNRIRGERADNLERAIETSQSALQIRNRKVSPQKWARTQNNLGNAYLYRVRGERADNLERAIEAYQSALQVSTREDFPQQWAQTQNNLGNAYLYRVRGKRADNLERAIEAYQSALQVNTREDFPQQWAQTQNNLGNAYKNYIWGEKRDNLERAIAAFQSALQVYTRKNRPQDWAQTQGNLALTLLEQFNETRDTANLDDAIEALQTAQSVTAPGTDAYVNISYALGRAFDYRYNLHRDPADLEYSIANYRLAADTTPWNDRRAKYQEKVGDSQYQMGVALTQEGRWYDGLAYLEDSLQTYRRGTNRLVRADALQRIALTHYLIGNFEKALLYFRDALRIYQAEAHDPGEANCRAGLGRLMLRLNFIDDAIAELNEACTLYRKLGDDNRLKELQEVYTLADKVRQKQPLESKL